MRGAAGAGLIAPFAFGPLARAEEHEKKQDFSGHLAVGVWISYYPDFAQPVGYNVIHSDGTGTFYNKWTSDYSSRSDPKLPVGGFIVWRPTGERTMDGLLHIAWGDTTVEDFMTFHARWTIDETGDKASIEWRMTLVDLQGKLLNQFNGRGDGVRMKWEPYEMDESTPATPEG